MVCFKCFLVLLYILPLPSLLGSGWLGWLGCLPLSGSPGLYTPTVLCISCRLCMHILCTHHCAITTPMMYWHLATGGL